ncbi:hypothetical protein [Amycolatopsis aidingensis]|uniref:hypothetical protein n=1 Tax=Amycolatopsis aidingensis TaxID=2842453 RepID=UPI001C0CE2F9|nr:hypothetical protein [Amycolatopsis aidingensis]
MSGLATLITAIALMFILFKIPFWFLSAIKVGSGRSLLGGLARAYIAGKTFGLVAGKTGGLRHAGPARATGRGGATPTGPGRRGGRGGQPDPPWPAQPRIAPTRAELDRRQAAVEQRLQEGYDADRARAARHGRVPPREPRFLQPGPQDTVHDPAVSPATPPPPGKPTFSATPRPAPPPLQVARRSTAPRFQAPGGFRRTRGAPPTRPIRVAAVPPQLRFQPAQPEPEHTGRPTAPAAPPAAPVFRPAQPDQRLGDARRRTHAAPPLQFRAPTPPATPAPPTSPPRGGDTR